MVLSKLNFTFLLCVSFDLYCCLVLGDFIIYRNENQNGDKFVIQKETCSLDIQASNCSPFGANSSSNNPCECICPPSNATFTYRDGVFRCDNDKTIVENEGCSITIAGKGDAISTLDSKKKSLRNLHGLLQPNTNTGCKIDFNGTQYQSCDGRWIPTGNITTQLFGYPIGNYLMILKRNDTAHLAGRLVKLMFTTACQPKGEQSCLLFKIQGNFSCPNSLSKPTISSTLATYNSTKVHIATMTNETLPISHFSANAIPTTVTTSNALATESEKPGSNKPKTSETKIIVIAVTANAVLIAIIAVLVLILCRMRKRQSRKPNTKDEEPYAEIPVGGDSILVGNHAYARLNSTKKKKNTRQRPELGELKNFPNPSFDDVPYEIPLPAPSNEPKDESFSYASLYDTVRGKKRAKKKKRSIDSGVHSHGTSFEDLASASPIINTVSSQNQQKDLVYSYAIPDNIPGGKFSLVRLPRPIVDTNSERRHSVASSSFSYDYAVPESPKKVQEVRDKDSQPSNSKIYGNLNTENHNSKSPVIPRDSVRSNNSGPYYHVLSDNSMQSVTGNDSSEKEQPYDLPEAVINAAFEDIEATVAAMNEKREEDKAELYLQLINQPDPHDLQAADSSDSKIPDCPVRAINEKTKGKNSWKERKGVDTDLQDTAYENVTSKSAIKSRRPELANRDSEKGEIVKKVLSNHEKDSDSQRDEDAKNQGRPKITNVDVFSNYC